MLRFTLGGKSWNVKKPAIIPPCVPSNLALASKARPWLPPGRANACLVIASDPRKVGGYCDVAGSQVSNSIRAIPFCAKGKDWRIFVRPKKAGVLSCCQWVKSQLGEFR